MSAENNWPFEAWLRLAVRGFRLSPQQFWDMSLRDWLILTRSETVPTMSADELSQLHKRFPDEAKNEEVSNDAD